MPSDIDSIIAGLRAKAAKAKSMQTGVALGDALSLADEVVRLQEKSDAEVLRLKACEHIGEGDDGWEQLRNICPSTSAVALLRDEVVRLRKENESLKTRLIEGTNA